MEVFRYLKEHFLGAPPATVKLVCEGVLGCYDVQPFSAIYAERMCSTRSFATYPQQYLMIHDDIAIMTICIHNAVPI